jgi:nucleoside-diphosphate-sugar epimerase
MKVLVTGGGGFLGSAVCARLLEAGHMVRSFSRRRSGRLAALDVDHRQGDLRDPAAVAAATVGMDAVVHCAANVATWGTARDFWDVNVGGTLNVLDACHRRGVARLVHTSSPSVVHGGGDLEGVDESAPYPRRFRGDYPRTKAIAEQHVLAANSADLATVSLRPHAIWGPGDPNLVPRIVARAKAGRLRQAGKTSKMIDTVYVDNAADAHLLALERLHPGARIAGRAYFITQDEPVLQDVVFNAVLAAAGLPPETRRVPALLVRAAGAAVEFAYRALRLRAEPPLTRYTADLLTTAHWFDISAARRDLGYTPRVDTQEGLRRLADHEARQRI